MKIPLLSQRRRQAGSVLLVCLLTAAILGITLVSYLVMTQTQNVTVMRSQTWDVSMAVTKAGIEDALVLVNQNLGDFELLPTWPNSLSIIQNNRGDPGSGVYYICRCLNSNSRGTNYYDVYVSSNSNNPPAFVGSVQ